MTPGPSDVDAYLAAGCGRCALFQTPQCKVHRWRAALDVLRAVLRQTSLHETVKWGQPCYVLDGRNVAMLAAFMDCCALSFFDGALLTDDAGLLERPGPNTQAARVLRFRSADEVRTKQDAVRAYVEEAVRRARAGERWTAPAAVEPMPAELAALLAARTDVDEAFQRLTPGRRRSFLLHVGGAKQSATRARRAEKCVDKILAGKGFHER